MSPMQGSPFPGMDPYLEMSWRDVPTALMVYLRDALQDHLPGDLLARVEEDVSIDLGEDLRTATPDVSVVEQPAPVSPSSPAAPSVADPLIVAVSEPRTERHLVIVDQTSGNRVVTAVEVLSPTNKLPGEGRQRYLRKQQDFLSSGVNLVEIGLVRTGVHTLAVPPEKIERQWRTPYLICVRRATRPGDAEIYRVPLREPLPTIRVPLRPSDEDVPLALQPLIAMCYSRGRYDTIDYTADPIPPLSTADDRWADELLRAAGRR